MGGPDRQHLLSAMKAARSAAPRTFSSKARPRLRRSTPPTSFFEFLTARIAASSPMSAGVMPTLNTRTMGVSSALRPSSSRPGARSNGFCTTRSRRVIGSAWSATATTTKAGPARRCPVHLVVRRRRWPDLLLHDGADARRAVRSAAHAPSLRHDRNAVVSRYARHRSRLDVTGFAEDPKLGATRGAPRCARPTMGDIIRPKGVPMKLAVEVIGTVPIERVDVLHGDARGAKTQSPFGRRRSWPPCPHPVAGRRISRARARDTSWDGRLALSGNRIGALCAGEFSQSRAQGRADRRRRGTALDLGDNGEFSRHRSLA